ncbi:hypothetical protein BDD12DRAFT_192287 [Trichophaea hybrida]|nr:hypothetical protein BDD12DRAFT_192287 [Trichophaea hybrida]
MECKKRSRSNSNHVVKPGRQNKRTYMDDNSTCKESKQPFEHPVLSLYFPRLLTLRDYLTQILASAESEPRPLKKLQTIDASSDQEMCLLLDSTLVGFPGDIGGPSKVEQQQIVDATQSSLGSERGNRQPQPEIVDVVLQFIFKRSKQQCLQPNNILCLGYRIQNEHNKFPVRPGALNIPVFNFYPNSHVNTLKSQLWDRLLYVIGEVAMITLLLKTCIFIPLAGGKDKQTYYQLCDGRNSALSHSLSMQRF